MNWPWEAIGAVGEILGAIAVVATLFYLTRQIRESTKMARANLSKDLLLTSRGLIWEMAANPEVAKIMAGIRGIEDIEVFGRNSMLQSFIPLLRWLIRCTMMASSTTESTKPIWR